MYSKLQRPLMAFFVILTATAFVTRTTAFNISTTRTSMHPNKTPRAVSKLGMLGGGVTTGRKGKPASSKDDDLDKTIALILQHQNKISEEDVAVDAVATARSAVAVAGDNGNGDGNDNGGDGDGDGDGDTSTTQVGEKGFRSKLKKIKNKTKKILKKGN